MPTSDRAVPFHMNHHARTLTCLSSAKIRKDCIQASKDSKMTVTVQSQNESSHAKVQRELSTKHLTWHAKLIASLYMLCIKPMCFVKPVDCFAQLHSKLQ